MRLRPLTQQITGDERPKQFCALLSDDTLWAGTFRRAARSASLSRILTVVTETDAPFYGALLRTHDEHSVVVQPNNRGTAPGILYGLLRVARRAPYAPVIVLPSDHWVSDEATFIAHVDAAVAVVAERPELS